MDNLPAEGVVLECSTNGGGSWTVIGNYDTPAYYNWTGVALPIPAAAQASAALFRWRQLSNSGTNYDHWALDNVIIGTGSMAPRIVMDPQSQNVVVGDPASLSVAAVGTAPLSYQWLLNGTNISGATASSLVFTNVQFSYAGTYSAFLSNVLGTALSSNAVLTVNPPPPCSPPPAGLVNWWRGEGSALNQVGTANGTLVGNVTYDRGRVGQAFAFGGANGDGVTLGNPASLQMQDLSIEVWVRRSSATQTTSNPNAAGTFFGYGSGGYSFGSYADGRLSFGKAYISEVETSPGLLTGTNFHHVAVTKSGGTVVFYVDGVAYPVAAYSPGFTFTTSAAIGAVGDLTYGFWGTVDELSIYNRALVGAEIQTIYNAGNSGKCGLAPSVQTPPQSQTIQCSSNASFSVTATGLLPLAYRWHFGANLIPGATNTLLTLTNVAFAQAGQYSVVITNTYGSVTGGSAMLTVVDTIPPAILSCASNRSLSAGANCTATLPDLTGQVVATDASGPVTVTQNPPPGTQLGLGITNVTFTVRDSSSNVSVCAGSVTVVDTTPPFVMACVLEVLLDFDSNCQALLPDLTSTNYIIASDNCSSVSVAQAPPAHTALPAGTNNVLLTVSDSASNQTTRAVAVIVPGEPRIALQPGNLTLAASSNATFSVLACGAQPLLYQWQHFSTNLPSATNVVLTLSNLKTNDAGDYRVVITNPAGSITSAVATLTVLQPPVITRQPRNAVAAPGAAVSFSVIVKGLAPLAYQWQRNGAPLAGRTTASLTISNVQTADFAGYTVGITNTDGGVLSVVAMLTLAASPTINSVGFNSSNFMLAVPTEVGPTYVVEYKNDLEDPGWNVLATLAGTGLSIPISDNGLTNVTRFYRVRVR